MLSPTYSLYRWMWGALDVLFPPYCGGCQKKGSVWCKDCEGGLTRIQSPICFTCGSELQNSSSICQNCIIIQPTFKSVRSYAYFDGGLRNAIHRLKYQRDMAIGVAFSTMLLSLQHQLQWRFELIIPVPLSETRFKQRGYNQSALIAYPFSLGCGKEYSSKALRRIRDTESQINLSRAERKTNVMSAFSAQQNKIQRKTILLIDDVFTTGATLNSCASALLNAGAEDVYCLTVAKATSNA